MVIDYLQREQGEESHIAYLYCTYGTNSLQSPEDYTETAFRPIYSDSEICRSALRFPQYVGLEWRGYKARLRRERTNPAPV